MRFCLLQEEEPLDMIEKPLDFAAAKPEDTAALVDVPAAQEEAGQSLEVNKQYWDGGRDCFWWLLVQASSVFAILCYACVR